MDVEVGDEAHWRDYNKKLCVINYNLFLCYMTYDGVLAHRLTFSHFFANLMYALPQCCYSWNAKESSHRVLMPYPPAEPANLHIFFGKTI